MSEKESMRVSDDGERWFRVSVRRGRDRFNLTKITSIFQITDVNIISLMSTFRKIDVNELSLFTNMPPHFC